MKQTITINNIQIKGITNNNLFNGEIVLSSNNKQQQLVMKNGMVILINSLQKFNGYSNLYHYTFNHNNKIDKMINNYQSVLSLLHVPNDYLIHAEDIQNKLETNENCEILQRILSLLTIKSNQLISIGFINTITGECLSLFDIVSQANVFQFIISNIFNGNGMYSTIGKTIIQEYLMIEMSNEIGYIIGKVMKMIIEEEFMDLDDKEYLVEVMTLIFNHFVVNSETQKDILFILRNIQKDWKEMTEDMKYVYVNNNKEILCELFELFLTHWKNPKDMIILLQKEIENIKSKKKEKFDIRFEYQIQTIIEECMNQMIIQMKEIWVKILKLFEEIGNMIGQEYSEQNEGIKNMINNVKILLSENIEEVEFSYNKNIDTLSIENNYFNSINSIDSMDDTSDSSEISDNSSSSESSDESDEEEYEDDWNEEIELSNENQINQLENNLFFNNQTLSISSEVLIKFIKENNLDLFHLMQMDDNKTFSNQLLQFFQRIKLSWETKETNSIYLNDKTMSQLFIYLMYCLSNENAFSKDNEVINESMKFITKVLQRDEMILITFDKSNKQKVLLYHKYFFNEKDVNCLLQLFPLIIHQCEDSNIQQFIIPIIKMYIETTNEEIIKEIKENINCLEDIFIELQSKREFIDDNEYLEMIGIIATKFGISFDTELNQLKGMKYKGIDERNMNLINNLLTKSRHNLINYYNKINENELTIGEIIGEGAYAKVKKGYYQGNEVAIKIFEENSYQFKREDFLQEIGLLSLLHHENIIKTYGATIKLNLRESSLFYIINEYASHGSLEMYITKGLLKKNKTSIQRSITLDIVKGLDYLHGMNILHRDLKPANILLGENEKAKISDFGLSTFVKEKENDVILGSFKWMSPERFEKKKYGKESDIYSLAIILWQIFECDEPFKQYDNSDDLEKAICERNERPLFEETPEDMKDIIELCWEKKMNKRLNTKEIIHKLKFDED